jgi:biotin carboxylase
MSGKVCVIIDPYSSSNLYASALKAIGYECIAVQSQAIPTSLIAGSFRPQDFREVIKFDGNQDKLVAALRERMVTLVVPGMEMGIELADALGEKMGSPFFNDPKTSHLRRDKFEMLEALKAAGLKSANQLKSSNAQEILAWATDRAQWPLVVKPADSGGADRVFLCRSLGEIKKACDLSFGSIGRQGRPIKEVVVQEFMRGTEYIVDTASYQGNHKIIDIWKYHRVAVNGANFVYEAKELMSYKGSEQDAMISYIRRSLDAVGLRNGPAHSEIMMTDEGPMLVEINARFGGSMGPIINRECLGYGQLEAMIEIYTEPQKFLEKCEVPYEIKKYGTAFYFIAREDNLTVREAALDRIRAYPSCYKAWLEEPGVKLAKTVDMFTMPGMVELVHVDPDQILKDLRLIRELESSGQIYEFLA